MGVADFTAIERQRRIDRLRADAQASGETEDEAAVRALKRVVRQMERARLRGVWTATPNAAPKPEPTPRPAVEMVHEKGIVRYNTPMVSKTEPRRYCGDCCYCDDEHGRCTAPADLNPQYGGGDGTEGADHADHCPAYKERKP